MRFKAQLVAATFLAASLAHAAEFSFDTPSDDRWHYPFNFTPGVRATASCFGAAAINGFNDRDAVVIVAWNTTTQITPGLGPGAYNVQAVKVTLTNQADAQWPIDLTTDEWFTYDLNGDGMINADGVPRGEAGDTDGESDDPDPGRPLELFGAGFGPTYTAQNWVETSIYVGSTGGANLPRDPFPFVYQGTTGEMLHVEDSVKGLHNESLAEPVYQFTPTPWAIGVPLAYTPGNQPIPFDVTFDLDLNLADGAVRAYFQEQLNAGRVFVIVSSLREATFMGPASGFPSFFMKEGLFLDPLAKAAQLVITLCDPNVSDQDGDGDTDLADFAEFATCFSSSGAAPAPDCQSADLDCDGDADLADYDVFEGQFAGPG